MKKKFFATASLLALCGAGWTGFWYWQASEFEKGVVSALEELKTNAQAPVRFSYERVEKTGFPLSVGVRFVNPSYTQKNIFEKDVLHKIDGEISLFMGIFAKQLGVFSHIFSVTSVLEGKPASVFLVEGGDVNCGVSLTDRGKELLPLLFNEVESKKISEQLVKGFTPRPKTAEALAQALPFSEFSCSSRPAKIFSDNKNVLLAEWQAGDFTLKSRLSGDKVDFSLHAVVKETSISREYMVLNAATSGIPLSLNQVISDYFGIAAGKPVSFGLNMKANLRPNPEASGFPFRAWEISLDRFFFESATVRSEASGNIAFEKTQGSETNGILRVSFDKKAKVTPQYDENLQKSLTQLRTAEDFVPFLMQMEAKSQKRDVSSFSEEERQKATMQARFFVANIQGVLPSFSAFGQTHERIKFSVENAGTKSEKTTLDDLFFGNDTRGISLRGAFSRLSNPSLSPVGNLELSCFDCQNFLSALGEYVQGVLKKSPLVVNLSQQFAPLLSTPSFWKNLQEFVVSVSKEGKKPEERVISVNSSGGGGVTISDLPLPEVMKRLAQYFPEFFATSPQAVPPPVAPAVPSGDLKP